MSTEKSQSCLSKCINFFQNKVKSRDMYGQPIALNFKGEESINTFIGGVISIFLTLLFTYYFFTEFLIMVNRDNTSINTNLLQRNWETDTSSYNLAKLNFAVGLKFADDNGDTTLAYDQSYFTLNFKKSSYRRDGYAGNMTSQTFTDITLVT